MVDYPVLADKLSHDSVWQSDIIRALGKPRLDGLPAGLDIMFSCKSEHPALMRFWEHLWSKP
jgi:hypothetical protein